MIYIPHEVATDWLISQFFKCYMRYKLTVGVTSSVMNSVAITDGRDATCGQVISTSRAYEVERDTIGDRRLKADPD